MSTLRFVVELFHVQYERTCEFIPFLFWTQHNEPELKFSIDDGIPSVQFVGGMNSAPIRLNIFDVVQVEVSAKDEKLKARIVPPN